MKRILLLLLVGLTALLLTIGCSSSVVRLQEEPFLPLAMSYEIHYVDRSAIVVEVLVLSDQTAVSPGKIQDALDSAFSTVAHDLGKSEILTQQVLFRDRLQNEFARLSGPTLKANLVIVDVLSAHVDNNGRVEVAFR